MVVKQVEETTVFIGEVKVFRTDCFLEGVTDCEADCEHCKKMAEEWERRWLVWEGIFCKSNSKPAALN